MWLEWELGRSHCASLRPALKAVPGHKPFPCHERGRGLIIGNSAP